MPIPTRDSLGIRIIDVIGFQKKTLWDDPKEPATSYLFLTNSKISKSAIIHDPMMFMSSKHRRFQWRFITLKLRVSSLQKSDPKPIIDSKGQTIS